MIRVQRTIIGRTTMLVVLRHIGDDMFQEVGSKAFSPRQVKHRFKQAIQLEQRHK